ncbi:hypothetical protein CU006_2215 [Enterococcus faecium]|nr:hypothetical protein [Enterococcus faecium]
MMLIVAFCPLPNKFDKVPFVASLKKGKLLITTTIEPNIVKGKESMKASRSTVR